MSGFLSIDRMDGVVVATMNRPDERNALTEEHQMLEFVELCAQIRRDPGVTALVLTGAGSAFSAGGNQQIPLALYEVDVPTIAAVNGPAIGAGLDLACMCDIRLASERATFASSFVKLGIVPGDGGAWLLARTIGQPKAMEMMLTGDTFDAARALALGLVSRVIPPEELMPQALDLAARISANPSRTVRLTKRLLRESDSVSLASSLEMAAAYQALAHYTSDHDEAVRAFLEKRKPMFTGR
jgi:enoyl-CoA hydratase/carnithine racemase